MGITIATALVGGFVSLLLLLLLRRSFLLAPALKLPPGPRPLPIVGNLLFMRKFPSLQDFANELKRRYGPIVTFWMGSRLVILISGPEIIQEAMISQGSVFNSRHELPSVSILTDHSRNVKGERHRFIRKLMVSEFLNYKRLAKLRPVREQEVDILVDSLKKQLGDKGGIISNFRELVRLTICNLIVGNIFGRRLTAEEYVDLDEVMVQRFLAVMGKPSDFIKFLGWLPDRKGDKALRELLRKIFRVVEPLIEERKQALKSGKTDEGAFVDTLLQLREGEIASPVEILDSDVVLICIELLNAGTDTTALNLEYCIANLINHPEIQEKLAQEISATLGETVVNEDDIPRLPYLRAVVEEALRRHSPARLAASRMALSATKVAGYDIPANATVYQHLEGVSLNPEIWEEPLEFRPERFLNKTVDITGSTEITFIPFGVGRRICPATNIAFLHSQLTLARLIQAFQWKPTIPGQLLDVTPSAGLTAPMKYPLVASVRQR